ncbi:natterin-4-like [Sardina pilchardus]|uniref:natterin-4-like n=1 Tax=Sardina pilchardus TaxID=27697 RepID=UPI002E1375C8
MQCSVLLLVVGLLLNYAAGSPESSDFLQTIHTQAEDALASAKAYLKTVFPLLSVPTRPTYGDNVHLKWVRWSGSLPRWAVTVFNRHANRTDYICSPTRRCEHVAGYYNPVLGPHCFTPCDNTDPGIGNEFDLLVNEHDLELLEWVTVEYFGYGEAPSNAVLVSQNLKRSGYILRHEGSVGSYVVMYWPKRQRRAPEHFLEILTVNQGKYTEHLFDVEYDMEQMKILSASRLKISKTTVANQGDSPQDQQVALKGETQLHGTWETVSSKRLVISTSITAHIPRRNSSFLSTNSTPRGIMGNSVNETVTVTLPMPLIPSTCQVSMRGTLDSVSVPFNASLQKTYESGAKHLATVPGIYVGTQIRSMDLVVDSCVTDGHS